MRDYRNMTSKLILLAIVAVLASLQPAMAQLNLSDMPANPGKDEISNNGRGTVDGPSGLTYYLDRPTFDGDFPGLPIEDFEDGAIAPGGVQGFAMPLNSTSSNAVFSPGDILPGIEFAATGGDPGNELVALGAGFAGNPSITVAANTFVESWIINFPNNDVFATGMDLQSFFNADTVDIDIYGPGGLIDSTTASSSNAGTFWGVASSGDPIVQIVIDSQTDQAEGCDNIAFGAGAVPTMPVPAMILMILALAIVSLIAIHRFAR